MAKKGTPQNGQNRLEDALTALTQSQAVLVQNQAVLVQTEAAFVSRLAENERLHLQYERETRQSIARIEAQMADIIRVLSEHNRQLERLTEAVRDKFGYNDNCDSPDEFRRVQWQQKAHSITANIDFEDAMATLIQNQAVFVQNQAENDRRIAENDRRHLEYEREANQRVARIEAQMADIIRVLTEHSRQLERLTEAVCDKIGYK